MKLSMWDVYYELGYDDMLPVIQSGAPTIRHARLLSSAHSNDETAYVGRASDYYDSDNDDALVAHRGDVILVRGATVADVFDALLDILDEYNMWERSLEEMAAHENGLQEMLDASDRLLAAPGFVYAPDGRAFALSSKYGPATHWHWAEIIANGGITSSRFRSLRDSIDLPEVWKDSYPRKRRSIIGAHAYMHCSLKPNGYMAGHFVLFAFEKPFRRGLERIADVLVKAMTRHMERFYWRYSPTSQLTDVFLRYFEGGELNESEAAVFLRALQWDSEDTFRVYVIRERSKKEPVLLSNLLSGISHKHPLAVSFMRDEELVVLENETRSTASDGMAARLPSLLGSDFCGGVSMKGAGIWRCRTLYRQAEREARRSIGTGCKISRADDNSYANLCEIIRDDELMYSYVHPELERLRRFDAANETQYYETLRAYVIANFHLSDAARYLGIHRNSLDYRLKRIREIIDFDSLDILASHYDEDKLMYLLMSFAVIDAQRRARE